MPYNFQFTFMGCQHNYLARVTKISSSGVPQDASITRTYGLPSVFADKMSNAEHKKRFFYNIRGHDFLSYSGQYVGTNSDDVGHVETAYVAISESALLESLRRENEQHGYLGPNMITCLGPRPGSAFIKAYSLKRYEWENLPPDLNRELLKICSKGYEKSGIQDLAINALGGWVILLNEGKNFAFGGELPFTLRILLQDAREKQREKPKLNISIYRIYLNHQHPEEYILIFNDGQCFVKLHSHFSVPLHDLLETWGSTRKNFKFNFTSSSTSTILCQQALNASYYARRGLFFLSHLNADTALHYLREASDQDERNAQIRERYCMAIVAMHRKRPHDPILEELITQHPGTRTNRNSIHHLRPPPPRPENQNIDSFFRAEYMWMLEEQEIDVAELEARLDELQRPFLDGKWKLGDGGPLSEWSYGMARKGIQDSHSHELGVTEVMSEDSNAPVEVEGAGVLMGRSETRVSELSSSVDEIEVIKVVAPQIKMVVPDTPVWEKRKSRGLFGVFRKTKD